MKKWLATFRLSPCRVRAIVRAYIIRACVCVRFSFLFIAIYRARVAGFAQSRGIKKKMIEKKNGRMKNSIFPTACKKCGAADFNKRAEFTINRARVILRKSYLSTVGQIAFLSAIRARHCCKHKKKHFYKNFIDSKIKRRMASTRR